MFNKLTDKLMRNCKNGKLSDAKGYIYSFSGAFCGKPLTVKVKKNGSANVFTVKYDGAEHVLNTDKDTQKFLTGFFKDIREKCGEEPDTGTGGTEEDDRYSQVGEFDETMPTAKELLKLLSERLKKTKGDAGGEQLSNYDSGRINKTMKKMGIYERFRIVYLRDEYYAYDKEKNVLFTISKLKSFVPFEEGSVSWCGEA